MWPFKKELSKAQLRFMAEQSQQDLEYVTGMLQRAMQERDAAKLNLTQLQKEKTGNLPPPIITLGIPQGHDPRDDLPADVVKLQEIADNAKRNFALAAIKYDELDKEATATFDQLSQKLATAVNLLTPAKRREYAKRLVAKGWKEPLYYEEKDTV